jgi:hypothetical protein
MMATRESEDLDRILTEIDPMNIPQEFISGACVTDFDDKTHIISCEELEDIMEDDSTLEELGIAEIGFILNVQDIKDTIIKYSDLILKGIPA